MIIPPVWVPFSDEDFMRTHMEAALAYLQSVAPDQRQNLWLKVELVEKSQCDLPVLAKSNE